MSSTAHSKATAHSPVGTARSAAATSCSLFQAGREAAFLDLDFQTADRPGLVTALLTLVAPIFPSAPPLDDRETASLWHLSLASRLKRLLRLTHDTENLSALPLRLKCPHADCQQWLEIELAYADLDSLHDEAADHELLRFPAPDSAALTFRRPTGDDLRRWRAAAESGTATPQTLFHGLLVARSATTETAEFPSAQALSAAFAEFDTLVAFQLATTCPHCTRESSHPVDLETLVLTRLHTLQQRLYRENHQLAQAYGWSESDILQVPRSRRLMYLAQLEAAP